MSMTMIMQRGWKGFHEKNRRNLLGCTRLHSEGARQWIQQLQ